MGIMPQTKTESVTALYSVDAETDVLGCMLMHPSEVIPEAKKTLSKWDFFIPAHQVLFEQLVEMFDSGEAIEPKSVHHWLEDRKLAEDVGSPTVLDELSVAFATHLTVGSYMARIKKKALARGLRQACEETLRDIEENADSVAGVLDRAEGRMRLATTVPSTQSRLTVRNADEICRMHFVGDSDNYFGDRMIAEGQNVTFLGPGGVGKSRMVMQLAISMILGRDFLGCPTRGNSKKWLFIQTENSNRRLNHDIFQFVKSMSLTPDEYQVVGECLFVHTLENDDDQMINLDNGDSVMQVQRLINQVQPDFVVFDPLNTFTSGDLNSDQDMRAVVSAITRLVKTGNAKRTPIVLHHSLTGKAGAAKAVGWDKASFGRNSKALQAWTRSQFNLAPRDPEQPELLILSGGKNNDGKLLPDIGIKFSDSKGLYEIDPTFDGEEFRESVGADTRKTNKFPTAKILELVKERPGLKQSDLAILIADAAGISSRAAYDKIKAAISQKAIEIHSVLKTVVAL